MIGLIWYLALSNYKSYVLTATLNAGLITSMMSVSLASYAFFVFFGRAATAITGSRKKAGTATLILAGVVILVLPLLVSAAAAIVPSLDFVWRELFAFSPIALLVHGFYNPGDYDTGGKLGVGAVATFVYASLALVIAVIGEARRYRRWKDFDYHYDMPAG